MKNNEEEYNIEERITNMLEEVLKDDSDSDGNEGGSGRPMSGRGNQNKHPVIMLNNVILDNIEAERAVIIDKIQNNYKAIGSPKINRVPSPTMETRSGNLLLNNFSINEVTKQNHNEITQR
jgi:hypothetical protein